VNDEAKPKTFDLNMHDHMKEAKAQLLSFVIGKSMDRFDYGRKQSALS
jgi:hypothetical protein